MDHPPVAGPRWALLAGLVLFLWSYGIEASAAAEAPDGSPAPLLVARSPGARPVLARAPMGPPQLVALPEAPLVQVGPRAVSRTASRAEPRAAPRSMVAVHTVLPRPPPAA